MPLALAMATFFMMWWIVLFVVLPLNITTQQENDKIVPGTPESAPSSPQLAKKMAITTAITAVLFALFYVNYVSGLITLDDIPFLPNFSSISHVS